MGIEKGVACSRCGVVLPDFIDWHFVNTAIVCEKCYKNFSRGGWNNFKKSGKDIDRKRREKAEV